MKTPTTLLLAASLTFSLPSLAPAYGGCHRGSFHASNGHYTSSGSTSWTSRSGQTYTASHHSTGSYGHGADVSGGGYHYGGVGYGGGYRAGYVAGPVPSPALVAGPAYVPPGPSIYVGRPAFRRAGYSRRY